MTIATDLVAQHEPWISADLTTYLQVIATLYSEVELYAFDTTSEEGYVILFDPTNAPQAVLPWLAQWIGERFPPGLTTGLQREWIGDRPNAFRGTVLSFVRAAQRTLIGQRTVSITERSGGDPDTVAIYTYTSETPSSAAVLANLKTVFPASMILVYSTGAGQTWNGVKTGSFGSAWGSSGTTVKGHYTHWSDVASDIVGITTYTRPLPP